MSNKIDNIEYLDLVSGIKALEYKEEIGAYLDWYADINSDTVKSSIIKVLDDTCYRLRLAYFGRFV